MGGRMWQRVPKRLKRLVVFAVAGAVIIPILTIMKVIVIFIATAIVDRVGDGVQISREVSLPPRVLRDDVLISGGIENTQLRQFRTERFRQRNGHCTEPTYPLFSFYASEGWTIDRASVEETCDKSSRSTCNGLRDVTEHSFNYSCTVANSGFCISPFVRDGRGSCWGEIKWTEQRVIDQQSDSHAEESNCDEATRNESSCRSGQY